MESKEIHLVCSGGGIKCLSYIGAIQKLLDNNMSIASVSACSMGTIIAAMVCYGMDIKEIEERLLSFNFKKIAKKKSFSGLRFLWYPFAPRVTPNYEELMAELLGKDVKLGELKIPFYTYALDIRQKRFLVYSSTHHPDMMLSQAIRIATAIPLFFEPYKLGKRILVDACVASESPIWIAANNKGFHPIVVLKPLKSPNYQDAKSSFATFLSLIISSSSNSHDYFVSSQTSRVINLDINCEDIDVFDFGIHSDQIENLILQGQSAAEQKLSEFNFDFNSILNFENVESVNNTYNLEEKAEILADRMINDYQKEVAMRNHIFVSYSHKDRAWMDKIKVHLSSIERFTGIKAWDDSAINPGSEWNTEISKALVAARVAIFLVTPDFLASDFIQDHEMGYFLEASKKEKVPIIWIAVSSSLYDLSPLANIQCANDPNNPLDRLSEAEQNIELTKICKKIIEIIK